MKKLLIWTLVITMLLGTVGCAGNSGSSNGSTATPAAATPAAAEKPTDANAETAPEPEVVKIGLLFPLTGTNTQAATEVQYMAKLYEDAINGIVDINLPFHDVEGLPNLGGAKIQIVLGDAVTPDIAMSEAERLITEEGVIGIVSTGSANTKTIMVPAEKYGCIVLTEGTSQSLTEAEYTYWGRSFPGDDSFCRDTFAFMDYMQKEEGADIKNVALVCEDTEFGANMANTLRQYAAEYNFNVVEDISYSATASNVTSEVLRLKKADPDCIIMSSYIADSLLFMSTYKEQNYFPKMLIGQRGGFSASDFITNLGDASNYCLSTARWNPDVSGELGLELAALFKEKYSGGIDLVGDVLTDSWNIYMLAIIANQAGSTDPDAMRAAMSEGIYVDPAQDPTGSLGYKYAENGQNEETSAIVIQMMDKARHTVYPAAVASTECVYPAPNWDAR